MDLLASHEAEEDYSIQKSSKADLALHTAFRCLREASLVSVETELGSRVTFFISSETCFRAVARGDLATEIFLYLRALIRLEPPSERSCLNFSCSNWMTNISVVDPRVSSSYYGAILLLLKKTFPSRVSILFFINLMYGKTYKKNRRGLQVIIKITRTLFSEFLRKYIGGSLVSA